MKKHFITTETGRISCPFEVEGGNTVGQIVPCIFRDIQLTELPIKAELEATALGIYEPWVNGKRVSNQYFAPGWTDYYKLVYVQTYDITSYLQLGSNRFGASLGDGWFAGNISACKKETYGNRRPEMAMRLRLQYADGREELILSDDQFRYEDSEVQYADYYMGTWIDHRILGAKDIICVGGPEGKPVLWGDGTDAELLPDYDMVVSEERYLRPISSTVRENGEIIYDFGQNFVGVVRIKVKGNSGSTVTLRYGEMLHLDESLYVENLRGAKSTDHFICSGEGEEVFHPTFTFHGFRYMEIVSKDVEILDVEGVVLTTFLEQRGDFTCDHNMINQLYSNIIWGLRGNFIDLPTDCPQRDERMGWAGDAQVFCRTAMYRVDCRDFYKKYLRNLRDTINEEGAPYELAPYIHGLNYGTTAWADAIVVIPYQHYLFYGDKSIITENLPAMEGYLAYQLKYSTDYCRPPEGYGDWLSVRLDETPKGLLGTAYFAYTAKLLAYMCKEIGETEKSDYYLELHEKVKDAFNRHYVGRDGSVTSESQCSYLVTLGFELVKGSLAEKVARKLRAAILRDDTHLTCGFVGISLMLPVLSRWNMDDLAYTILLNDTYPSWGYTIKNGATTIWERWNSYTKEEGFGDVAMNSFNHYSLGSCGEWFTGYMCGILPDIKHPGFEQIVIKPHLDSRGRVKKASAYYDSAKGRISSAWKVEGDKVQFDIGLPKGMKATLVYGGQRYQLSREENTMVLSVRRKRGRCAKQ